MRTRQPAGAPASVGGRFAPTARPAVPETVPMSAGDGIPGVMDFEQVLRQQGAWAHGDDIPGTIAGWQSAGFDPEGCQAWLDAGTFDADTARVLADDGITPDQAGQEVGPDVGVGRYAHTIGYKVSNGDLTLTQAKEALELA